MPGGPRAGVGLFSRGGAAQGGRAREGGCRRSHPAVSTLPRHKTPHLSTHCVSPLPLQQSTSRRRPKRGSTVRSRRVRLLPPQGHGRGRRRTRPRRRHRPTDPQATAPRTRSPRKTSWATQRSSSLSQPTLRPRPWPRLTTPIPTARIKGMWVRASPRTQWCRKRNRWARRAQREW